MFSNAQSKHLGLEFHSTPTSDLIAAIRESLSGQTRSHVLDRAIKAGDMAPKFRLPDTAGEVVALSNLLRRGPVVVSFFWGYWCPLCNLALDELADADAEIKGEGATLVGISPRPLANGQLDSRRHSLPFPLLKDTHCKVGRRYGLTFLIPPEKRPVFTALGHPSVADGPSGDWLLPIPATYVIDTTGRIVLSYLDTDYRTRFEPAEIVLALRHFRERSPAPLISRTRSNESSSYPAPGYKRRRRLQ